MKTLRERFEDKFRVDSETGCWIWTSNKNQSGYGTLRHGPAASRRTLRAHRVAYELLVGPIPEGLMLDHLCRNRLCVNPTHLEPVTNRENLLRGDTLTARHATKTHCDDCRQCSRQRSLASYWRNRDRRLAARRARAANA